MVEKEKANHHQRNKRQKETHKWKNIGFQPLPHISTSTDGTPGGKTHSWDVSITVRYAGTKRKGEGKIVREGEGWREGERERKKEGGRGGEGGRERNSPCNDGAPYQKSRLDSEKHPKEAMVSLSYTVSQPGAVVVKSPHTAATRVAVLCSKRTVQSTYPTVPLGGSKVITRIFLRG